MAVSLPEFESMSEKDKQKTLKQLKNEIGVSGIAKTWEISRSKVYNMFHAFNVPVDPKRGRQRKKDKTSPEKELDKPVRGSSSNTDQEDSVDNFKSLLQPKENKEEKFSFYLETQGTGSFINETLQLLTTSGKLSGSVLHLSISIEEM